MSRGLIVARFGPGTEAEIAQIFAESDAGELPQLVGVEHRSLFAFQDVYLHYVETTGDFGSSVERVRDDPLFQDVSERLAPLVTPYDPATWRSPTDSFARQFYSWERSGRERSSGSGR